MNKSIILFLLQLTQTLFSIGICTATVLIWYYIKFNTLSGVQNYIGLRKPPKGHSFAAPAQ